MDLNLQTILNNPYLEVQDTLTFSVLLSVVKEEPHLVSPLTPIWVYRNQAELAYYLDGLPPLNEDLQLQYFLAQPYENRVQGQVPVLNDDRRTAHWIYLSRYLSRDARAEYLSLYLSGMLNEPEEYELLGKAPFTLETSLIQNERHPVAGPALVNGAFEMRWIDRWRDVWQWYSFYGITWPQALRDVDRGLIYQIFYKEN